MSSRPSKKKRPMREDKMDKVRWPLEEGVFDRDSLLTLERFMKKGVFHTVDYCVARGKEANVYRCTKSDGTYVALKMYRLRSPSFLHMEDYIQGDRRFEKTKKSKFGLVFTWTRKEYSNLKLMAECGVRVPKPIAFKHNVLAMEFLGRDGVPYSKLSEVGSEDPERDCAFLLDQIERMRKNGLVHADLSEYNVLVGDDGLYIIDVGQAVLTTHPKAEEFYARDVANVKKFFGR